MRFLYLHGFASGAQSGKAQYFRKRMADHGVELEVPDLDEGDSENLTVSGQISLLERILGDEPVSLIGSSMGGYVAALFASRHPSVQRMVLLAPAFGFPGRWIERLGAAEAERWRSTGYMDVFHYSDGRQRRISWKLVEDGAQWPSEPPFSQPALIFHGRGDDVVPPECSEVVAARHPNVRLRLFDSDHQLTDCVDAIWEDVAPFLLG